MAYNEKSLAIERSMAIVDYLKKHKTATVDELAKKLYVSVATIRRDLNELQKKGQVKRSHGGAVLMEDANEVSILIRQIKNVKEKEHVASIALKHLPEFSTVFIDNSSTCLALAEKMNFAHKTVVTNGLQVALCVAKNSGVTLIMPGGEIKYNTSAVLGTATTAALNNYHFDLSLTSCAAFDENGCYEVSLDTMQVKKAALHNSKTRILLFDRTKIGTVTTFRTAEPNLFHKLITDADDEAIAPYKAIPGIRIINR